MDVTVRARRRNALDPAARNLRHPDACDRPVAAGADRVEERQSLKLLSDVPPERVAQVAASVAEATGLSEAKLREALGRSAGSLLFRSAPTDVAIAVELALQDEGILTEREPAAPRTEATRVATTAREDQGRTDPPEVQPHPREPHAAILANGTPPIERARRLRRLRKIRGLLLTVLAIALVIGRRLRKSGGLLPAVLAITLVIGGIVFTTLSQRYQPPGTLKAPRQAGPAYIRRALGDCRITQTWRTPTGIMAGVITLCEHPDGHQQFRLDYDNGQLDQATVLRTEHLPGETRMYITSASDTGDHMVITNDGTLLMADNLGVYGMATPMRRR